MYNPQELKHAMKTVEINELWIAYHEITQMTNDQKTTDPTKIITPLNTNHTTSQTNTNHTIGNIEEFVNQM